MSRAVTEALLDAAEVAAVLQPRDGVVEERAIGDGVLVFEAVSGPMRAYERRVSVEPDGDQVRLRQEVEWQLDIPYFHWLFDFLFRSELRKLQPHHRDNMPWWHPPERVDRRAAGVLGVLGAVAIAFGYLNTLFSQSIAFAAEQFNANDAAQGVAGSAVRLGGVLALVLIASADRFGRRRLILVSVVVGCLAAASGALAPSLPWLTASQLLARAFSGTLLVVVGIAAAEEMPAGARAYAISVLALASGFGAGICVAALRIADLGIGAWRILYVIPLLALPFCRGIARRLPESKRYAAPHKEVSMRGHGARLLLLGVSGFVYNLYIAPASQFSNRFLRVERGYSGGGIALLSLATGTPSGLAVVLGGRLAETRGRRLIGATTLIVGTGLDIAFYFTRGASMWSLAFLSSLVFDASIPALAVYGPELFPTSLRGRANGIIAVTSLAGSALGLALAGYLADRFDRIGPALAVVSIGPLLLAALVITRYPETAHRELEDLNPEDA